MADAAMHDVYLPFTEGQLREHFAPVGGEKKPADRKLDYYRKSLARLREYEEALAASSEPPHTSATAYQHEKDERFWVVAALMGLFYPDHARVDRFARALSAALGDAPAVAGASTWEECLEGKLHLYFEVSLPSPPSYRAWLSKNVEQRALIPHLQQAAGKPGGKFEGHTHVDAVLVAESGFAVLFEAKVLSDVSSKISYDVMRNQIARNVDVMLYTNQDLDPTLNQRDPDRTCFVLLTPEIFRDNRHSRLYGWLMDDYRTRPEALRRDLPHRGEDIDLGAVSERIGWLTFEDCHRIDSDVCRWLSA